MVLRLDLLIASNNHKVTTNVYVLLGGLIMAKIKRPEFLVFINTTPDAAATYNLAGVFSEDLTVNFNAETEETGDVTSTIKSKSIVAYAPSFDLDTKIVEAAGQKGYVLSSYIEGLQESLAAAGDAETTVLLVKNYKQGTLETDRFAQKFDANITFNTLGGSYDSALGMSYTVDLIGEPVDGDAVITTDGVTGDKTAAFTPLA